MVELLYIVLLIISLTVLIKYIRDGRDLLRTVFFGVFVLYYILTPTILGFYGRQSIAEDYRTPYFVIYNQATESDQLRVFVITLFVFLLFIVLREAKLPFIFGRRSSNNYQNNETELNETLLDNTVYHLGIVFLVLGGIALAELIMELGGISRMLSLGSIIRGYRTDNADYLSPIGSICKTLSIFVTGSFFCFYSSSPKHKRHKMFIIISMILSIVYLLFNSGRGPLLLFFGCIFFAILKERGKKVIGIVLLGFIGVALLSSTIEVVMNNIARGYSAFYNLQYNMSDNILSTITDLAYPYSNLLALPEMIERSGYNFGLDYVFWFSEVIPKRLFSFVWNFLPQTTLVTTKVSQFYITAGLSLGGTPADYITYGWFQGHVLGLFVNCCIYDALLKRLDKIIFKLPVQYSILKYRMAFFAYSLITSNDFPLMIKNNLFLIIIMIVIKRTVCKKAVCKKVRSDYERNNQ